MAAKLRETRNLGVPRFYKGVHPSLDHPESGFYDDDRHLPNRTDGRPSNSDFLPKGLLTQNYQQEVIIMATPSTKTPGADLGTAPNAKKGLKKNLDPAGKTGLKPINPGNNLK